MGRPAKHYLNGVSLASQEWPEAEGWLEYFQIVFRLFSLPLHGEESHGQIELFTDFANPSSDSTYSF